MKPHTLRDLMIACLLRQLEAKGPSVPVIPAGGDLLWKWFMALHRTRQTGFSGPEPIRYGEIEAYNRLMGEGIEPRHITILLAMDHAYLDAIHQRRAPVPDGVKKLAPVSSTPITAGTIDAMFGG
ncbi:hypothetical protein MRS76_19290 [Rhizobiaceae bacterium n13]|uniref:phage tail assembly chaperone n=1 Tax=Ferirhizobium litorale TaxID=2927786 RepID=UPI0024B2FFFC|nr:hypothetical protein [Fererhizobium litorale]MDI7864097.1 hypothetical protein [Fererhizobium litorale]